MIHGHSDQDRFGVEDDQGKFSIVFIERRANNRDVYGSGSDEVDSLRRSATMNDNFDARVEPSSRC